MIDYYSCHVVCSIRACHTTQGIPTPYTYTYYGIPNGTTKGTVDTVFKSLVLIFYILIHFICELILCILLSTYCIIIQTRFKVKFLSKLFQLIAEIYDVSTGSLKYCNYIYWNIEVIETL